MTVVLTSALLILGLVFIWLRWRRTDHRLSRLPPGPPPLPLIGNLLQLKPSHSWLYYAKLRKTYGDILSFSALGQNIIVLNSYPVIHDLVVGKAAVHSDRPRTILAGELVGFDQTLPLMHYGSKWITGRKVFHSYLGKNSIKNFAPQIELEARSAIHRMHTEPDVTHQSIIHLLAARLIVDVAYGHKVQTLDDEIAYLAENISTVFSEATQPGRFFVDILWSLRFVPSWAPFAGFKAIARRWNQALTKGFEVPFETVKQELAAGTARPSFARYMLQEKPAGITEQEMSWLAGSMYGAGVDTIATTIDSFILAMCHYPEFQHLARQEIEKVIGTHRLPELSDRPNLPYIENIFKEVLRWNPLGPLAIPYCVTESYTYKGYHIPKDATVLANAWAVSQDPLLYPDPQRFNPDRYLDAADNAMDPRAFAFGFGRRICPGQAYGESVTWTAIATLLATTVISKARDERGEEIIPPIEFGGRLLSSPAPFRCSIVPSSEEAAALLQHASS